MLRRMHTQRSVTTGIQTNTHTHTRTPVSGDRVDMRHELIVLAHATHTTEQSRSFIAPANANKTGECVRNVNCAHHPFVCACTTYTYHLCGRACVHGRARDNVQLCHVSAMHVCVCVVALRIRQTSSSRHNTTHHYLHYQPHDHRCRWNALSSIWQCGRDPEIWKYW